MKQRRVCLDSGYKFVYAPTSSAKAAKVRWKSAGDAYWDTEVTKAVCGKLVGHRRIDGAPVTVVRAGGKLYAATYATRGNTPSRSKPGTKFEGILDIFRPKRKKARVGSKAVYIRSGSSSGNIFRGARRRRR